MSSSRLAGLVLACTVLIEVLAGVFLALSWSVPAAETLESSTGALVALVQAAAFAAVGALVAVRRPANLLGWLFLGAGCLSSAGLMLDRYAAYALVIRGGDLPGGELIVALTISAYIPLLALFTLILLLFPNGSLPSARWRPLAWLIVPAVATAMVILTLDPGPIAYAPPLDTFPNPVGIEVAAGLLPVALVAILTTILIAFVAALSLIFGRFPGTRGDERQQYKWLALSAGLVVAGVLAHMIAEAVAPEAIDAVEVAIGLAVAGVPFSVGIAILRYRLYDIDRLISRTLTYALLTACLALVYAGVIVALQAALRSVSGGSSVAVALTTLLVAGLFLPAQRRLQLLVDRRFNRRAHNAQRAVDIFAQRLREQIDLDTLRYELLAVVDETMQPVSASVWLRSREAGP